jgi:protein associated with RNAse G/E
MNRLITVHKLDHRGQEVWSYRGSIVAEEHDRIVLEARFDLPDRQVEKLWLRRGDRFLETYYRDRWYNVFAVHDSVDDHLKGWYCNITRPARFEPSGTDLFAEDLALDMIVYPDRHWTVLDVEEFASLPIDLDERQNCLQALSELQSLALRHQEPFAP